MEANPRLSECGKIVQTILRKASTTIETRLSIEELHSVV